MAVVVERYHEAEEVFPHENINSRYQIWSTKDFKIL